LKKEGCEKRDRGGIRAVVTLAVLLTAIPVSVSAAVVNFADPGLDAAIRETIAKPTGDIHDADLVGLTRLNANGRSIADLEGIQHCTDLTQLDLSSNRIVDIHPLSGLAGLTVLYLNVNRITGIGALAGLTDLTCLDLSGNQIVDIRPLSGLTDLTVLYLNANQIADIGALSSLTDLICLDLGSNRIVDIQALSGLSDLTVLYLNANRIADIGALSGLTDLICLDVSDNQIVDIGALSGLTDLAILYLDGNRIAGIGALSALTDLTYLDLSSNQTVDIGPLSGLTRLTVLYLDINRTTDIAALSRLTDLMYLDLSNNRIADIHALSGLTNDAFLLLDGNRIVDVSALSGLPHLTQLSLKHNRIVDLAPLVGNPEIRGGVSVDLRWNQLLLMPGSRDMSDIEALRGRGALVDFEPQNPPADTAAVFRVEDGFVFADRVFHAAAFETGAADIAEWVHLTTPAEPGVVVEFDPIASMRYRVAQDACSSLVAGVISTAPGVTLGGSLDASERALLTLAGVVPVKVTHEGGPIQPGDLLVTSSTPGHAMRWTGAEPCPCSLVGKALEPMTDESGVILVLLTAH